MHAPEVKEIPRVDKINEYLERSMREIREEIGKVEESREVLWEELNEVFLQVLKKE